MSTWSNDYRYQNSYSRKAQPTNKPQGRTPEVRVYEVSLEYARLIYISLIRRRPTSCPEENGRSLWGNSRPYTGCWQTFLRTAGEDMIFSVAYWIIMYLMSSYVFHGVYVFMTRYIILIFFSCKPGENSKLINLFHNDGNIMGGGVSGA